MCHLQDKMVIHRKSYMLTRTLLLCFFFKLVDLRNRSVPGHTAVTTITKCCILHTHSNTLTITRQHVS